MVAGVSAYGTAPDWLALLVGLLGLAVTLMADLRYLRLAIARRHFSFWIDRAILLSALAVVAAIFLWRLIGSGPAMRRTLPLRDAVGDLRRGVPR